jgi:hypothetical protein
MTMAKNEDTGSVADKAAEKPRRAGDNDDGVNADELMGTQKSEYSSQQDDSMLSDDAG